MNLNSLARKFQHPRSLFPHCFNLFASVSASHVFLEVVDLQTPSLSEVVQSQLCPVAIGLSLAHSSTTETLPPVRLPEGTPTTITAIVLWSWVCIFGRCWSQHTHETNASCVLMQLVADQPRDNPQLHLYALQSVRILFETGYIGIFGLHVCRWCHRRLRTSVSFVIGIIIFFEFPVPEFALIVWVPASKLAVAKSAYLTLVHQQKLSMPFGFAGRKGTGAHEYGIQQRNY